MLVITDGSNSRDRKRTRVVSPISFGIRGRRGAMADAGGGRELLEPRLGAEESREKLVLIQICDIWPLLNVVDR